MILKFAEAYDWGVVNTFFFKEKHIITYKNERNRSQVDYLVIKREMLKSVKIVR